MAGVPAARGLCLGLKACAVCTFFFPLELQEGHTSPSKVIQAEERGAFEQSFVQLISF